MRHDPGSSLAGSFFGGQIVKPDVVDSIETLVPVAEDWDGQTKPLSELAIGEAVSEITVDGRIYGVLTILGCFFLW